MFDKALSCSHNKIIEVFLYANDRDICEIPVENQESWNLVGLPVYVSDNSYQTLFPGSIDNTLFSFSDGTYTPEDELILGEGYWLRFSNEGFSIITGIPIYELIINLNEGWNLISGISNILDISEILDPDGIIIPGTLYSFNSGGYFNPEILEPGNGYWIRANISGTITILVN